MFRILLLCLIPVCLCVDEQAIFQSIQDAVDNINQHPPHVAYASACYDDIGCFDTTGPMKHTGKLPESPTKIGTRYYAYSQSAPTVAKEVLPKDSSSWSTIGKSLAVIIHGWNNNGFHTDMLALKTTLLKQVSTVISVDWEKGADATLYTQSAVNTELVGHQVGFLINQLKAANVVSASQIHLIGFSLGAQVAGFAGKYTKSAYGWTVGRITGLDAAAPLFESYPGSYVTSADATFVDMVHTSAGGSILTGNVGMEKAVGHVDFYPNNGKSQPRCSGSLSLSCNHWSAVFYYDASISNASKCTAYRCDSWADFTANKCGSNADSRMGYHSANESGAGSRYLNVVKASPYCQ